MKRAALAAALMLAALFLLGILSPGSCSRRGTVAALPKGPPIRIRLQTLDGDAVREPLEVEAEDTLRVFSVSERPVLLRELPGGRVALRVEGERIAVGEHLFSERLRLAPLPERTLRLFVGPRAARQEYRGSIDFFAYRTQQGAQALDVVNELGLEEYLAGVVGKEMGGEGVPLEALKAQAVAARTYTLFKLKWVLENHGTLPPTVAFPATTSFQAYVGASAESPSALRAVRETSGRVLTFGGKLFQAYYHAACGGRTTHAAFFGETAIESLAGVPCLSCAGPERAPWRRVWPRETLQGVLQAWARTHGVDMAALAGIAPLVLSESSAPARVDSAAAEPHCDYVRVEHSGGSFEMRADRFRELLGRHLEGGLPSTSFRVRLEGGQDFVFEGAGRGHGVGLCQSGASAMGRSHSCGEILAHYFPQSGQLKVY